MLGCVWEYSGNVFGWVWKGFEKQFRGGQKNTISLKDLTKLCQKITLNKIKIRSKKTTSVYDIPNYVTDNFKVKKIYKWSPQKKILHIVKDVYKWMILNKPILKKYIQ